LLPVVRKFLAAIEAHDIGPASPSRHASSPGTTNCEWETVMSVPATENRIHKFRDHVLPPPKPNPPSFEILPSAQPY
jgi:hypothetical protein